MDEPDFEAAMEAPAPPARQERPMVVVESGEVLGDITLPSGTDISPTALSLVPYEEKVKALILRAREIVVDSPDGQKEATALGNQAKDLRKKVEAIKQSPAYMAADSFLKEIRNLINALTAPLKTQVEQALKDKLLAYSKKLLLEKQAKEAAAREEARKAQAELDAEAERQRQEAADKAQAAEEELRQKEAAGNITEGERSILEETIESEREAAETIQAPTVQVQVESAPTTVRTEKGSSFVKGRWKARLVDLWAVDKKYFDNDAVREAVTKAAQKDADAGLRNIPGFIVEEDLSISFRG